jgi:hypothetical protein
MKRKSVRFVEGKERMSEEKKKTLGTLGGRGG